MKRKMFILVIFTILMFSLFSCKIESKITYDDLNEFLHVYSACDDSFVDVDATTPYGNIDYAACFMNAYRYVLDQKDKQHYVLLNQLVDGKAAEIENYQIKYKEVLEFIDKKSGGKDETDTLKDYLRYIASFDVASYYYANDSSGDFDAQGFLTFIQKY